VRAQDVSFISEFCLYQQNTAENGDGGSLYLSWSLGNSKFANFTTNNNSFKGNTALFKGGAIYYDLYSPKNLLINIY